MKDTNAPIFDPALYGYSALLRAMMPISIAYLMSYLPSVIDAALVGHYQSTLLAQLAVVNRVSNCCSWLFAFLSFGVVAEVGSFFGANRFDKIVPYLFSYLAASFVLGSLLAIIFGFFGSEIFQFFGVDISSAQNSGVFYYLRLASLPLYAMNLVLTGVLRGIRCFREQLLLLFIVTGSNVLFSFLGLTQLDSGLNGIACANLLSLFFGFVYGFWTLSRALAISKRSYSSFSSLGITSFNVQNLFISVRSACMTLVIVLLTRQAAMLGSEELVACHIMVEIWMLIAFSFGGISVLATSYGASLLHQNFDEFLRMNRRLLIMTLFLSLSISFTLFFFSTEVLHFFTDDSNILEKIHSSWKFFLLAQPLVCLVYALEGILNGAQKFRSTMLRTAEGTALFCLLIFFGSSIFQLWVVMIVLMGYRFFTYLAHYYRICVSL